MKTKIIFMPVLLMIIGLTSFTIPGPVLSWDLTIHDFGLIEKNRPVTASFTFENTGNAPLIITNVKGSCGCTVTEYTRGEISSGDFGKVKATYNAAKTGVFNKTITVTANAGETPIILRIKGEVAE